MSKYFKPYRKDIEDPVYPEDVKRIKEELEASYGKVKCSNKKLGELWREFSDEVYDAYFLNPDDQFIKEFASWLEMQK